MKKLFLTPLIAALILLMGTGTAPSTQRMELNNVLTLEQQAVASVTGVNAEYQTTRTYLSEVFETQTFQLLSLNWQEELPGDTAANLEIRFRSTSGEWTDWQNLHEDEDGEGEGLWSYVITEDSDAFQYRAFLSTSDSAITPKLADFTFDSVSGGKEAPIKRIGKALFRTQSTDIVSRYSWGANESLRLAKNFEHLMTDEIEAIQTPVDPRFTYDPDLDIVREVETNTYGDYYWWALEYPKEVKKIIVHHTATTKNLDNPSEAVRAIYQYHTLTRAWGDIGYNFIIGPDGTVYQGRAGGSGVVGAHAGGFNSGTVGIALLGNYQENEIPAPMLASLEKLVNEQASIHGIDLSAKGSYRGLYTENLLMHKEVNATSCPGQFTGDYISALRKGDSIASSSSTTSSSSNATVINQTADLSFDKGQSKMIWVQLKNNSGTTWKAEDLSLTLTSSNGASIGPINSTMKTIPPGATPRLFFTLTAPSENGNQTVSLQAQLNGKNLLSSAHKLDLLVNVDLPSVSLSEYDDQIRIKLTTDLFTGPIMTSTGNFSLYNGSEFLKTFSARSLVKVRSSGSQYLITSGLNRWTVDGPVRFIPEGGGVMRIANMEQRPAWNPNLNDNLFRGTIEIQHENGALIAINELAMEDYLKGVAEVSNDTHFQKAKAMSILARTYATYYITQDQKFPGKPYDLDDNPDNSQKYLGYGYELRSSQIDAAVESTSGMVVTYNGKVVKTPYFSQSAGRTKSAQEVWGWTNTPYLQSVSSPCEADTFYGHGVGLDGCGAEAMAQQGKTYTEIIKYYFTGVQVERYTQ